MQNGAGLLHPVRLLRTQAQALRHACGWMGWAWQGKGESLEGEGQGQGRAGQGEEGWACAARGCPASAQHRLQPIAAAKLARTCTAADMLEASVAELLLAAGMACSIGKVDEAKVRRGVVNRRLPTLAKALDGRRAADPAVNSSLQPP